MLHYNYEVLFHVTTRTMSSNLTTRTQSSCLLKRFPDSSVSSLILVGWCEEGHPATKTCSNIPNMKYMKRTTIPAQTPPELTRSALPLMAQGGSVKLAMGRERGVKGDLVSLRIGSVYVTTMKKRDGEVVDMAARRHLDFCCLQETGWKGKGARKLGEYKFFWMGCSKGIHGVGLLVADRWTEKVLEVRRVSERLMLVRVIVGRTVLNLISAYVPQAGRHTPEKEFFTLLGKIVSEIDDGGKLLICGDWNGYVGCGGWS